MKRYRQGWVLMLAVGALAGCQGTNRVKSLAAAKSGCEPDAIQVVRHDNTDVVLDVCGVHENWEWHAVNGWEYLGPAATQPNVAPTAAPVLDSDGDGVADTVDACADKAGPASADPATNGCPPPPDSDADAIPDTVDACPQQSGVPNADAKRHGCPPPGDSDGDGITDDRDACPQEAGKTSPDPARNGCKQDADDDGVDDAADACPSEKGVASETAQVNGCPAGLDVTVTTSELVLATPIGFVKGAPVVSGASKATLDAIAKSLADHPEITNLEIRAHADEGATGEAAEKMSQARAEALKKALVERGVDAGRLTTKAAAEGTGVSFAIIGR